MRNPQTDTTKSDVPVNLNLVYFYNGVKAETSTLSSRKAKAYSDYP